MLDYIYADNAATTQLDKGAFDAMSPYMLEMYGNPSQPYSFSRTARKGINEARKIIADCIGAKPEEIFFTSGGTESDNWALNSIAMGSNRMLDKAIVVSEIEHHAVLNPSRRLQEEGIPFYTISPDRDGLISPQKLDNILGQTNCGLVSIMTANNEIGTIEPIAELCEVAHAHGAIFHTDAVQAIGHIEINVNSLGIDMLSASAHKFNGPKGIGFLYIRNGIPIRPFLIGGAQERNCRAGTENVASIVGMAYALRENCLHIAENIQYISSLEDRFLSQLSKSDASFKINGALVKLPGLISISFEGQDGEAILHRMDLKKIAISTGSACDSKRTEISHVLKSIGLEENYAKGTVRISLGKNNTYEDVDKIVDSLVKIIVN